MHEGRRPGGLTALAVLNFVLSGLGVIAVLLFFASTKMAPVLAGEIERQARARAEGSEEGAGQLTKDEEQAVAALRSLENLSKGKLVTHVALSLSSAGLLLVTGIGYVRQRRWARLLANVYAAVSIASTLFETTLVPRDLGGGLRFAGIIYFIWPLLTVALVNTTFREDLRT